MENYKKIAILALAVLVLSMSACGKTEVQGVKGEKTVTQTSETNISDDIFLKISAANTRDMLMKNHDKVGYSAERSYANGDKYKWFAYQDKDRYILFGNGDREGQDMLVDKGGNVREFYEKDQCYILDLFVGERAYEESKEYLPLIWHDQEQNEKVVSVKESGDRIIVESETSDVSVAQESLEFYEYKVDEYEKSTVYYEIDAKTYEIYKRELTYCFKDGSSVVAGTWERVEDYDKYLPSEEIIPDTEGLEERKVTLIENPGAADEIKHEYSVPVGWKYNAIFSSEYEYEVYADAEYTTILEQDDLTKDVIGYIRKEK